MSGFEFNKILITIILTVILVLIIDKVGDLLVDVNHKSPEQTAYIIEIPVEESTSSSDSLSSDSESIELISDLLATASLDNGEKIYKKCGSCHNYEKNSKSKVGPNLWNIINREKAGIKGFAYSKALSDMQGSWSYEDLNKFLYKPKEYIEGTKMNFIGLKNASDRADLILWLRQLSDDPVPLP